MLLIGENLNVINREIGKAFKEKDPGPFRRPRDRKKRAWTGSTSIWVRRARAVQN
jgi:hypothetical protein